MSTMELTPLPTNAVTTVERDDSLVRWILAYADAEVQDSPQDTIDAKRLDFQQFLDYFALRHRSDALDDWTRSTTKGFITWLQTSPANGGPERGPYSVPTINRRLATLRHFVKWISTRRPFLAGNPFERIRDLQGDDPETIGLTTLQRHRVDAALDKLTALHTRKNQQPLKKRAIALLFKHTVLRTSEVCRLDRRQYDGKYLYNVKRKGNNRTKRVFIAQEAREALDAYLAEERQGDDDGPLFTSRTGHRTSRQSIDVFLKQIADLANLNVPDEEKINLHAHLLRHTGLKQAVKLGQHVAQKLSGNVSRQHLDRYTQPLQKDFEADIEGMYDMVEPPVKRRFI